MNRDEIVQELIKLEPVFMKVGNFAVDCQKDAKSHNKFSTGQVDFDIVTETDLEVQERILQAMSKTPLKNCRLLAEEKTESVNLFNPEGELFLTLDPIDGTSLYADGKRYWSIIISLHDDKEMLYTFDNFPAANWANKIVGKNYELIGEKPEIEISEDGSKTISYSYGTTDCINRKIYNELIEKGYTFKLRKEFSKEAGSTALFLAGQVGGYFNPITLAYDSLVALHYAQAMGFKVYIDGLNLAEIKKENDFVFHPGYYVAIRD